MILNHAGLAEAAVRQRLLDWLPYMKALVEAQNGYDCGQLPALKGIVTASELARWPEDQIPCAIIVSPGTVDDSVKKGEGSYQADYSIAVAVVTGAASEADTRLLAELYGAAVRGAVLHRRKLAEDISVKGWGGESFDDFDPEKRRTRMGSLNLFTVEVENLANWKAGPIGDPPDDPCAAAQQWIAQQVDIEAYPKT